VTIPNFLCLDQSKDGAADSPGKLHILRQNPTISLIRPFSAGFNQESISQLALMNMVT